MDYRGKHYTIVPASGPDCWKWTVHLDDKTVRSGEAESRAAAANSAVWVIDKALAANNTKLVPPSDSTPEHPV